MARSTRGGPSAGARPSAGDGAGRGQARAKFDPTSFAEARRQKVERAEKLRAEQRARLQAMGHLPSRQPVGEGADEQQSLAKVAAPPLATPWAVGDHTAVSKAPQARQPLQSPWAQEGDTPKGAQERQPLQSPWAQQGGQPEAAQARHPLQSPWAQEGDQPESAMPRARGPASPPWAQEEPGPREEPPARADGRPAPWAEADEERTQPLRPAAEAGLSPRRGPEEELGPQDEPGRPEEEPAHATEGQPPQAEDGAQQLLRPRASESAGDEPETQAREGDHFGSGRQGCSADLERTRKPADLEVTMIPDRMPQLPDRMPQLQPQRSRPPLPTAPPSGRSEPAEVEPGATVASKDQLHAGSVASSARTPGSVGLTSVFDAAFNNHAGDTGCSKNSVSDRTLRPAGTSASELPQSGLDSTIDPRARDGLLPPPEGDSLPDRQVSGSQQSGPAAPQRNPDAGGSEPPAPHARDGERDGRCPLARCLLPRRGASPQSEGDGSPREKEVCAEPPAEPVAKPAQESQSHSDVAGAISSGGGHWDLRPGGGADDRADDDPDVFGPPRPRPKPKRRSRPRAPASGGAESLRGLSVDKAEPVAEEISDGPTMTLPDFEGDGEQSHDQAVQNDATFRVEVPGGAASATPHGGGTNLLGGLFGSSRDGPGWMRQMRPASREAAGAARPPVNAARAADRGRETSASRAQSSEVSIEDFIATAQHAARVLSVGQPQEDNDPDVLAAAPHIVEAPEAEEASLPAKARQPIILRTDMAEDFVSDDPMVFGKPRQPQKSAARAKPRRTPSEPVAVVSDKQDDGFEDPSERHASSEGKGSMKFVFVGERPRSQPLQQRQRPPRCPEPPAIQAMGASGSSSSGFFGGQGGGKPRKRPERDGSRNRLPAAPSSENNSEVPGCPPKRGASSTPDGRASPLKLPSLDQDGPGAAGGRRCASQPPAARPAPQKGKARPKSQSRADEEKCERRMFDKNTLRQMHRDMFMSAVHHYRQSRCKPIGKHAAVEAAPADAAAGGISVFLRKRPIFSKEEREDFDVITTRPGTGLSAAKKVVLHSCLFQADLKTPFVNHLTFQFDHVFDERVENSEVYRVAAAPIIRGSLEGGIGTMFMFGQTGSGKTHTMSAIQEFASKDLFGAFDREDGLSCQYVELRGNRCFDLLAPPLAGPAGRKGGEQRPELKLREQSDGAYSAEGAMDLFPNTPEELCSIMEMAQSRRATSATDANAVSSRSHAVCTLRLAGSNGQLLLVDCAGTERRKDSMFHSKERQQEGAEINASLHALKECIRSFASHQQVPKHMYRASSLTKILADAFIRGDSARLAVICTASPCATDTEHTIATLRMGMALGGWGNEQEDKQMMSDCVEKKQRLVHPKQWTPEQVFEWLASVSDGQFQDLVDALPSNTTGQMLCRFTVNRCAQLCGGSERRGKRLFDALHREMQAADESRKG